MTRTIVGPISLALAACAGSVAQTRPTPEAAAVTVTAAAERDTFFIRQGGATVMTERFTRTPTRLEAELRTPAGQGAVYEAQLRSDGSISRIHVRELQTGDVPPRSSTVIFQGDSAHVERIQGDSITREWVDTRAGAIPYINPSPSLMEQIIHRARAIGGARVEVPIFVAGGGAQTVDAIVSFDQEGSATLELAGVAVQLSLGAGDRVLGGMVPVQGVLIERSNGGTP